MFVYLVFRRMPVFHYFLKSSKYVFYSISKRPYNVKEVILNIYRFFAANKSKTLKLV